MNKKLILHFKYTLYYRENMNLLILFTEIEYGDCSMLKLIFDAITAFGVVFVGIGLLLNKRSEFLAVIEKNTKEFREIVRREKMNEINGDEIKKRNENEIIQNDFLGQIGRAHV